MNKCMVYIYIHTYTNLYHYIEDFCSFMQAWCSAYRHPFYNRSIDFIKLVDFPDCVGRFWKIFLQRKDLELVIRSPASRFCDGGPWPRVWSSVRLTCLALSCVLLSGAMHRGMQLQFVFRSNHTTIAPATQPEADQSLRHRDVCRFVILGICPCPACRMFQCNKSLVWRSGTASPQVCILYRCWMPPKICLNTELHDELKRTLRSYRLSFTPGALRDYMSVSTLLQLTPCSSRWLDESWWLDDIDFVGLRYAAMGRSWRWTTAPTVCMPRNTLR